MLKIYKKDKKLIKKVVDIEITYKIVWHKEIEIFLIN